MTVLRLWPRLKFSCRWRREGSWAVRLDLGSLVIWAPRRPWALPVAAALGVWRSAPGRSLISLDSSARRRDTSSRPSALFIRAWACERGGTLERR